MFSQLLYFVYSISFSPSVVIINVTENKVSVDIKKKLPSLRTPVASEGK